MIASSRLRRGIAITALCLFSCTSAGAGSGSKVREVEVVATAYNSLPRQTHGDPNLTAWGDRLRPGMKAIAVSRDLVKMGLTHGVEVEISGLQGRWVVRDKMAKRWRHRIDLYMGEDVQSARRWGRREVTIRWTPRAGTKAS